jgi:23S rRNA (guanine745-N1)-methyltransferase
VSNKIKSAKLVGEFESAFKCPNCESSVKVAHFNSLICSKNHTFDFAKQGYLNLMTRPGKSQYTKELFEARHKIIVESNLYIEMHKTITKIIMKYRDISTNPLMIADLGCGEGSHLQRIIDECMIPEMNGVGLDISKEGIVLAAKKYEKPIWLVGDLANSPLADQSFHVILNILSPANYKEFKRILVQDGIVIKVVPRPHYLKELREALLKKGKNGIKNEEIISLFKSHFKLLDVVRLSFTKTLTNTDLKNLVQMTPLTWSSDPSRIDAFLNRESSEITVDLDILVGLKLKNK